MAKKKNNNKNSASKGGDNATPPETPTDAVPSPTAEASSNSISEAAVSDTSAAAAQEEVVAGGGDVEAQLKAAQAEIAKLKEQLRAKDKEIELLRSQNTASITQGSITATADPKRNEEMEKLRERLASLKREQAEADSARENAWRQLKDVVAEITKLAAPQELAKTPTAAAVAAN